MGNAFVPVIGTIVQLWAARLFSRIEDTMVLLTGLTFYMNMQTNVNLRTDTVPLISHPVAITHTQTHTR